VLSYSSRCLLIAHVTPLCNSSSNPEKALCEGRFHAIIYHYFPGRSTLSVQPTTPVDFSPFISKILLGLIAAWFYLLNLNTLNQQLGFPLVALHLRTAVAGTRIATVLNVCANNNNLSPRPIHSHHLPRSTGNFSLYIFRSQPLCLSAESRSHKRSFTTFG
jgi:hypothetical protein